jgi:hypothetical protein
MLKKTRFTKMLLSVIMTFVLLGSNAYADTNIKQSFFMNDEKNCTGKIIPSNVTDAAFSDEIDYAGLADFQYRKAISFSGDNVTVNLSLFLDSTEVQLRYEGKMYKSFRFTDEKPVYIGVFKDVRIATNPGLVQSSDSSVGFEIIYFEISNDVSPYNLKSELRKTSSITMYLRSNDGTIYDLGSKIESPVFLDGVESQAPSDKDMNWFLNFFQGTYSEEKNNSTRSVYTNLWAGDLHTLRYRIADYEHSFMACPYIEFSYGDVPTSGEKKFGMSLKISESHRYRMVGTTNWTVNDSEDYGRCFLIDNVQLAWTAGGNTVITYVTPKLNTPDQGDGSFDFLGIVAGIINESWLQSTALSVILTVADSILGSSDEDTSNTFTNTSTSGMVNNTSAYKMKFPSNYYIEKGNYGDTSTDDERFEFIAEMATVKSDLPRAYWTYAIADFTFRLCWGDITGQSGSKVYTDYKELGYYNNH